MSKSKKECSAEYCNFQPVFADTQKTHFKYYQCEDCKYILTDDDISFCLDSCHKDHLKEKSKLGSVENE